MHMFDADKLLPAPRRAQAGQLSGLWQREQEVAQTYRATAAPSTKKTSKRKSKKS
jgi:hypothetical protein